MLFNEISKKIGLPITETFKEYKIVNIGSKSVYVQNYLKLLVYQQDKVVLKVKSNELIILGKNFVIKELEQKSILIKGVINSIHLAKEL